MPNTHVSHQSVHMPFVEYIANKSVILPQMQPGTVDRKYTRSILSTMLQDRQAIIK